MNSYQLVCVRQQVNVQHVCRLDVDHEVPCRREGRLAGDAVKPLLVGVRCLLVRGAISRLAWITCKGNWNCNGFESHETFQLYIFRFCSLVVKGFSTFSHSVCFLPADTNLFQYISRSVRVACQPAATSSNSQDRGEEENKRRIPPFLPPGFFRLSVRSINLSWRRKGYAALWKGKRKIAEVRTRDSAGKGKYG